MALIGGGGVRQQQGCQGTEVPDGSKGVGVWDGRCLVWSASGTAADLGTAAMSLYLWFSRRLGRQERWGRQAFIFVSSRTAWAAASDSEARSSGWRQRGRWRWVETMSEVARVLASGLAASISVSEGINVRDGSGRGHRSWGQRQQGLRRHGRKSRRCYVRGQRQQGRWWRLRQQRQWQRYGDGKCRRKRQTVSGRAGGDLRDGGGEGDRGRRNRVKAVSGSEGGDVEGFGFWMGVGVDGIGDGSSNGDGRRQQQNFSGVMGAGGGVGGGSRRERGHS